MKLTYENNKGQKVTVEFPKVAILDQEVDLDTHIALEPLWEALKVKIAAANEKKNA